jgi:hypothetical protein
MTSLSLSFGRCSSGSELTKLLPVKDLALSLIHELNECFWFEGARPTCREAAIHAKLIAETDLNHPIILCADGRVMDGMHRGRRYLVRVHGHRGNSRICTGM